MAENKKQHYVPKTYLKRFANGKLFSVLNVENEDIYENVAYVNQCYESYFYDVPWIDTTLDQKLKQEIEEFPDKVLPRIYELLEKYSEGKQVIVFKSRAEADEQLYRI